MKIYLKYRINILFVILYVFSFYKGIGYFIPAFNASITIVMILCSIVLFLVSLFSYKYLTKKFVYFLIGLLVLFLASTIFARDISLPLSFLGILDIISIFSCIAIVNEIESRKKFMILFNRILIFCKIFLIVQIPVSILQYIRYGANDFVSGTLGSGGSGILTCMCILCVFLLIKSSDVFIKKTYEFKYNYIKIIIFSIGLIPIFLNETKVSIILLPLLFLGIANFKGVRSLYGPLLLISLFFFIYSNLYSNDSTSSFGFADIFSGSFLDEYLMGDLSETDGDFRDIPRFTKMMYAFKEFGNNLQSFFLGNDYGAFKGGTSVAKSTFAKNYEWLLIGSRPLIFNLFIMGGFLFTIVFIIFIFKYIFIRLGNLNTNLGIKILFAGMFVILLFYNDSLLFQGFSCMYILAIYCAKKIELQKFIYESRKEKFVNT